MTNILHIVTKLELGGAQKSTLYLLKKLSENYDGSFKLYLFASAGLLLPDDYNLKNITIHYSKFLRNHIHPFFDVFVFFELIYFINKNHISIVHTHSSKAGIIGRFAAGVSRVKSICHTVHGFSFNKYTSFFKRSLYCTLEYIVSYFTDLYLFVCNSDIQKARTNKILRKTDYLLVRENFPFLLQQQKSDLFSIGFNHSEKYFTHRTNEQKDLVVTMIACLKPQKAPQDFIQVAKILLKKYSNIRFQIIGDGILRSKLQDQIARYEIQDKCIILGWVKSINAYLTTSDIIVLTSKWEGLPIVLYEALFYAKPIVATNVDGISEVVSNNENGFLVEPGNVVQIAAKVEHLIKDEKLRKGMGENGRNKLKNFESIDIMVERIAHYYLTRNLH